MSLEQHKDTIRRITDGNAGYLRMIDAINAGISRRAFYSLRDSGFIEQESRGLYRLADQDFNPDPDISIVSLRYPTAVISLISALSFHDITTQIPHSVHIFLPVGTATPRIEWPPVSYHFISGKAYLTGIETHDIGGVKVNIYSIEKTIADCFKFRNKIGGLDVCLEALRTAHREKKINYSTLFSHARICRVFNVMLPYTQAMQ